MSTEGTDEWTEEKRLQMIRAFRARPVLWDTKHPLYFRQKKKVAAWQEIGRLMNSTPELCKHKMGILMSSFRREKSRTVHSILNGETSNAYTSNWFGYKDMSFLLDKEAEKKRQRSGATIANADEAGGAESLSLSVLRGAAKRQRVLNSRPKPLMKAAASSEPAPSVSTESDEEIKSFANFISSKMKKYSETTKNAVQQAICEIIFKADQRLYEIVRCDIEIPGTANSPSAVITTTEDLAMIEDEKILNDSIKAEVLSDYDD